MEIFLGGDSGGVSDKTPDERWIKYKEVRRTTNQVYQQTIAQKKVQSEELLDAIEALVY